MHPEFFSHIDPSPPAPVDGGPLRGKRAAVQCCISVKGRPTEAGSQALRGFVSLEDAGVVERLRAAGAALVGNTQSAELGFGLMGDGAAQAIESGAVDLALVTDTMGEARVAAASVGAFGFKPSYGRLSRFGLVGMIPSMDCCGILAQNLRDIAAAFEAIEGADERDPSMADRRAVETNRKPAGDTPSAGVVTQSLEILDSGEREAFEEALGKLRGAGVDIRELSWANYHLFRPTHNVIGSVEASSSCGKFDGVRYGHCVSGAANWNEMYLRSRGESFGPLLKAYLFQGAYFQFENYSAFERACGIRARLIDDSRKFHGDVDVLVFPTRRAGVDFAKTENVEQVYDAFSLTLPANLTGRPALTVPGQAKRAGADLGLQLVGPLFGDERLFEIAERLFPRTEGAE